MIEGKSVLAIIPARGGSKGLPGKNILFLGGKPLIAWTIDAAKKSKYIDRLICSTEDEKIAHIARENGCEIPFMRPHELAKDDTSSFAVIEHAVNILNEKYDYLVLLQPTSPFRSTGDIDSAIELSYSKNGFCVSITESAKSPYWMYKINSEGFLEPVIYADANRRQDLPKTYSLNGAVYVAQIPELLKTKSFVSESTVPHLMPKIRSVDIDDEIDFLLCETILQRGLI